jgi:uncharacterized membrane protein YqgA involved in biofilm formation
VVDVRRVAIVQFVVVVVVVVIVVVGGVFELDQTIERLSEESQSTMQRDGGTVVVFIVLVTTAVDDPGM